MPLYSSDYLKGISRTKTESDKRTLITESHTIRSTYDIFLSHSYLDKSVIEGLFIELTKLGYTVYVDWIVDPNLDRTNVTKAVANHIRSRLKISKTLILAISTNAETSKWIPWELGCVDGSTGRCAILPITDADTRKTEYQGREYLSVYPYLKKIPSNGSSDLVIVESPNVYVNLKNWVAKLPPTHQSHSILNL